MSGRIDLFRAYVRTRLERWGCEFAIHRDCEYLGHASKSTLYDVFRFQGRPPGKPTGYKPLELDKDAHEVELIVTELSRVHKDAACVMRAMYCGQGRRGVERLEQARLLAGRKLTRSQYYHLHDDGFAFVRDKICELSVAA